MVNVVIIGLGTGGFFSALNIRKYDRDAKITIIDRKDFDLLHTCGIPYAIGGGTGSFDALKHNLPDMGFEKMLSHEAVSVDVRGKSVRARDIGTGKEKDIPYDWLIIASGSGASIPPIPGAKSLMGKGVFKVDDIRDSFDLNRYAESSGSAVVIGAGAIGLETAYALRKKGLDVVVVEALSSCFPKALDGDMAGILHNFIESEGIALRLGTRVESINGSCRAESVTVDGDVIKADIVVIAAGVKGNYGFAESSGIEIGKFGIAVDDRMRTNAPFVYAVGDIVQVKSLVDGRDTVMQLAVAAYKQALAASSDILMKSGKNVPERRYRGALGTFASKIGSMEIAATGLNSSSAGKGIVFGKASGMTRPGWCIGIGSSGKDGKDTSKGRYGLTVKVLVDRNTHRIVGGQAVGFDGAAHRIDVLSAAIQAGFTVHDLSGAELCYCPAISDTYDLLMQAADNAIRKLYM